MDNKWDLYRDHPRFEAATQALDRAWEQATWLLPNKPAQDRAMAAEQHVYGVMGNFADAGAMDSEPLAELRFRVRNHFGCGGGWL